MQPPRPPRATGRRSPPRGSCRPSCPTLLVPVAGKGTARKTESFASAVRGGRDEPAHQLRRLVVAEPLATGERLPGGKGQRMTDRRAHAPCRAASEPAP